MDTSEKLVADFLVYRGHSSIVYEPDGNVPPDFLVDGRIAIEVRRLNQNWHNGMSTQGLENAAISLWMKVKKLALSLGPPTDGTSWFICFSFGRPVEPWKTFQLKLRATLTQFMQNPTKENSKWTIGHGFEIELFQASEPHFSLLRDGRPN